MSMNTANEQEKRRLAALREYRILDTGKEQAFDDLIRVAACICQVPMATISLVDESRQWFKAAIGIDATETPRNISFCTHTILGEEPMIIGDATQDSRFAESPLVKHSPGIRFYAGFPLLTSDGLALGALCAIDNIPRQLSEDQMAAMKALSRQVMALVDFRRVSAKLAEALEEVRTLHGLLPICAWCRRIRDDKGYWGEVEGYLARRAGADFTHGICPECLAKNRPKNPAAGPTRQPQEQAGRESVQDAA
jgi:GAF domain-containing protein